MKFKQFKNWMFFFYFSFHCWWKIYKWMRLVFPTQIIWIFAWILKFWWKLTIEITWFAEYYGIVVVSTYYSKSHLLVNLWLPIKLINEIIILALTKKCCNRLCAPFHTKNVFSIALCVARVEILSQESRLFLFIIS